MLIIVNIINTYINSGNENNFFKYHIINLIGKLTQCFTDYDS